MGRVNIVGPRPAALARPVSLQRANLTGQPLRRPMAWRRAAYRRPPCPFMHSFCGQVPELLRPARAGAGIHRVPEKEAAYRPGVVLMVASSRAAAARHRAAPGSASLRPLRGACGPAAFLPPARSACSMPGARRTCRRLARRRQPGAESAFVLDGKPPLPPDRGAWPAIPPPARHACRISS